MPRDKIDLHTHTHFSDGVYSPEEIVKKAYQKNIKVLSITDHDSVDAFPYARPVAERFGIELISGIEFSSIILDKEIHILGYFFNPDNDEFQSTLIELEERRLQRADKICQTLNTLGVPIKLSDVTDFYDIGIIGRPHIASTMVKKGYASSFHQAFSKYLWDRGPAYQPKVLLPAKDTIDLIHNSGGLAFLAHPGNLHDDLIIDVINRGLDGLEIVHPSQNANRKRKLVSIVNKYGLLKSGGSDFHGGDRNDEHNFGKVFANPPYVDAIKDFLLRKSA